MKILLDDLKIENPCDECDSRCKNIEGKIADGTFCVSYHDYLVEQSILSQLKEVDIDEAAKEWRQYNGIICGWRLFSQFLKEWDK